MLVGCAGSVPVPDGSRCTVDGDQRACEHATVRLPTGAWGRRSVHHQVPLGDAPEAGWPVAVLFQGSLHPASGFWEADEDGAYGAWEQVAVVESLLDAGFAVVTPDAQFGGSTFWNTNVLPWSAAWTSSPDHALMLALLEATGDGTFGAIDGEHRFAAGISSGGYMTSRMALSYPGEFRALAVQSASWATCGGLICSVPDELPADHPPTLFLHGESDSIVPIGTMERYADALDAADHEVRVVTDPAVGHAWLPSSPDEVVGWFRRHP